MDILSATPVLRVTIESEVVMADMQKEVQGLNLVDGYGIEPAIMTKPSDFPIQCDAGRHCAHHGDDPFFCCKCGAEFTYAKRG